MLRRLAAKKRITRLYQGLWADTQSPQFHIYLVTPFLTRPHPAAISMLTALHLHGMIEQIPQVVDVVSTAMTKKIKTPAANYVIHQMNHALFVGYEYYQEEGDFLIASPEKALFDCAYFSARKGQRFKFLPELHFPKSFSHRKLFQFVKKIPYHNLRRAVEMRLENWLRKEGVTAC